MTGSLLRMCVRVRHRRPSVLNEVRRDHVHRRAVRVGGIDLRFAGPRRIGGRTPRGRRRGRLLLRLHERRAVTSDDGSGKDSQVIRPWRTGGGRLSTEPASVSRQVAQNDGTRRRWNVKRNERGYQPPSRRSRLGPSSPGLDSDFQSLISSSATRAWFPSQFISSPVRNLSAGGRRARTPARRCRCSPDLRRRSALQGRVPAGERVRRSRLHLAARSVDDRKRGT